MTNREIYDTALALLGEVDEELCRDYEQRTPYLLGAFIGECSELGGFYRAARGEADGEVSLGSVELDAEFPLPERFSVAAAAYVAALLVEAENEALSDRLFARYADELSRISQASLSGQRVSIRDAYAASAWD